MSNFRSGLYNFKRQAIKDLEEYFMQGQITTAEIESIVNSKVVNIFFAKENQNDYLGINQSNSTSAR